MDGEKLEGATLQVVDSEGNVVDEWISERNAHEITGLKIGEEYTLKETDAPDGYMVADEISFVINEEGNITTTGSMDDDGVILLEDAKTKVSIKKTDVADGRELPGAELQIVDSEGNVVDEWTSTREEHEIEGLKTGEEYTLKETKAPTGTPKGRVHIRTQ